MKRLMIICLVMILALSACSSPTIKDADQTYTTNNLSHASDYDALFKIVQKAQNNQNYRNYPYFAFDKAGAEMASQSDTTANGYSLTNIQVEGVDEADIIKTDGSYLYLVANNRLYVVDVRDPANMTVLSVQEFLTNPETDQVVSGETPLQMYLDPENQRLTLIISGWINEKVEEPFAAKDSLAPDYYMNSKTYTTTRIYDISDKSSPKMIRQFSQSGYYVNSRKIGDAVYIITNEYKYMIYAEDQTDPNPEDIFPTICSTGSISFSNWNTVPADRISILPNGDVSNQMVIAGIDTMSGSDPDLLAVLGTSGIVYASTGYLYIAAVNYPFYPLMEKSNGVTSTETAAETSTDVYRFKLENGQITEAGQGNVPGTILNQFSMDEFEGDFRIATTSGGMWSANGNDPVVNNLFILDSNLKSIGQLTGLAPGETIKSVRFMGEQAYVVTFRNVDPLFVINLENPAAPSVMGQLKIPGYSTYLHPYAENLLLGFGFDVKNEGETVYTMGLKVSLFDVSDFANPRELSTILLGSRGSYSEVLDNQKALLFSKEKNLIAFPATLTKTITNDPLEYGQNVYQGLMVLTVNAESQLTLRGHITHFDDDYNAFYGYNTVNRGAWVDSTMFTFSDRQIRSASIDNLTPIGSVVLPGFRDSQRYLFGGGTAVVNFVR